MLHSTAPMIKTTVILNAWKQQSDFFSIWNWMVRVKHAMFSFKTFVEYHE